MSNQLTTKVTRLEIIDGGGRSYTNYRVNNLDLSLQDEERTLKIFVSENAPDPVRDMYDQEPNDIARFAKFCKKLLLKDELTLFLKFYRGDNINSDDEHIIDEYLKIRDEKRSK